MTGLRAHPFERRALRFGFVVSLGLAGCNVTPSEVVPEHAPEPTNAPVVRRATADEGECEIEVEGPEHTQVGHASTARVALRATGGYKVNREAPLSLQVVGEDVRPDKRAFSLGDASYDAPDELQFLIPFTSLTASDHSLEVHAKFGICSDDNCSFCSRARELELQVAK